MARKAASGGRSGPLRRPGTPWHERGRRFASIGLCVLDFLVGLGRKVAGFFALLTLGWIYFQLLVLGESTHQLYPDAIDPDLRQTLWVALLLIVAQGWDISTDHLAALWNRIEGAFRRRERTTRAGLPLLLRAPVRLAEPVVVRLGRFMDLCVAIANKVGAFAVLVYLVVLLEQFALEGATVRDMYPAAEDPWVSFLADLCVYVVVLAWWATPFEAIAEFWRRLRQPLASEPGRDDEAARFEF